MHYKRKRPQNRRAGCKLCKPWKVNGVSTHAAEGEKCLNHKRRKAADAQIEHFLHRNNDKTSST